MKTLREVVSRITEERVDLGQGFVRNLEIAVGHFERANGLIALSELTESHIRGTMRHLIGLPRSAVTVNNNRRALLYLWERAHEFGWIGPAPYRKIHKVKEPERLPTAWNETQIAALLSACQNAETRRNWGPTEWEALTLTIYDTSLRIGCLLRSLVRQFDAAAGTLFVPGEFQKGRRDTLQRLHPSTVAVVSRISRLPGDERLFPWPFHRDELWRRFSREILIPAGLPATRRDKFHRVRRTSYTYVACAFGVAAASEHAAHKEDLSRFYLDPSFLARPNPLDALPRPRTA